MKGGEKMSEREAVLLGKITDAIPNMTDFDKGYLLGKVEEMAASKEREQLKRTDEDQEQEGVRE